MSQEGDVQQIEAWATRVEEMGLTPVVVPLLELARPLGFLISQAFLFGEPLLIGMDGHRSLHKTAEWLQDPESVDRLLARLLDE